MKAGTDRLHVLPDSASLARAAAGWILDRLEAACRQRGRATLALSGGSTPAGTFEALAGPPGRDWPHWHEVVCYWVDERAVGPHDPASNFGLVQRLLFERLPNPPRTVHRIRGEAEDLDAEARRYQGLLAAEAEAGVPCLDVVLLGLGADGHVASLFPGAPWPSTAQWVVVAAGPPPHRRRLTCTPVVLDAARHAAYLVAGRSKREILRRVRAQRVGPESPDDLPASRVRRGAETDWFLDTEAAPDGKTR